MNTAQMFLSLAPAWVSLIQALEQAIPQKGAGNIKLKAFNDQVLSTVAIAAPLASAGISAPHDPATITLLSTQFAANIITAMNAAKASAPTA